MSKHKFHNYHWAIRIIIFCAYLLVIASLFFNFLLETGQAVLLLLPASFLTFKVLSDKTSVILEDGSFSLMEQHNLGKTTRKYPFSKLKEIRTIRQKYSRLRPIDKPGVAGDYGETSGHSKKTFFRKVLLVKTHKNHLRWGFRNVDCQIDKMYDLIVEHIKENRA